MASDPLFSGGVASIVYKNAIEAIPHLDFRLKFLEQCRAFPQTERLRAEILDSIKRDFPLDPSAYVGRARFSVPDMSKALAIMDEGFTHLQGELEDQFRIMYLNFITEVLESGSASDSDVPVLTNKYHSVSQPPKTSHPPSSELRVLQSVLHLNLNPSNLSPISEHLTSLPPPEPLSKPDPNLIRLTLLLSQSYMRLGSYVDSCKVLSHLLSNLSPHDHAHVSAYGEVVVPLVEALLSCGRVGEAKSIVEGAPQGFREVLVNRIGRYELASGGGKGWNDAVRWGEKVVVVGGEGMKEFEGMRKAVREMGEGTV
jgi:hypothetical protein